MEFLKYAGAVFTNAVDALADANRRLALTNRLKAIDRAETAKAKTTYEALGRYVAANIAELDMEGYEEEAKPAFFNGVYLK